MTTKATRAARGAATERVLTEARTDSPVVSRRATRWRPFIGQCVVALVFLALPWPGLGKALSDAWCSAGDAVVVPVAEGSDVRVLLKSDDSPWRATAYMARLSTRETASLPVELRQLYLSLATFVALAVASYRQGWRSRRNWLIGFGALLLLAYADLFVVLLMAADDLGWSPLPAFERKVLGVALMSYNGFPGMAFAVPAMLWSVTIGRAALYRQARCRTAEAATPTG